MTTEDAKTRRTDELIGRLQQARDVIESMQIRLEKGQVLSRGAFKRLHHIMVGVEYKAEWWDMTAQSVAPYRVFEPPCLPSSQ